jgi:V/A-type H+-transporting ATPase subunit I
MLIGDAGYGLLFIAGTFTAHKKLKDVPKEVFILFYILSVSTLIWGAVTGTWFGYEKLARFPFVNILVIDSVNSFIDANMVNIIKLNFMIGLVQLCIAHLMIAFRERKSLKVLGQAGWVMVLFGLYFLAGKVVLNNPFPWIAKSLIFYGMLLVILFSVFNRKHIIKGFLAGLGELLNNFVSYFSHIVSYLRLFAVGYASVTIASSFNDMALSAGVGGVFATLGFALILLIGHGLNIALGGMAVVVHGIRLNMLEFSGHLNMQWSGSEYKPFSK